MARRGGPSRRMQGNPLGGILRDLDRRTRPTGHRRAKGDAASPVEGPRGPRGAPGQSGPPGVLAGAATVLVTGEDGRARLDYGDTFDRAPVLSASVVDGGPLLAVWETVGASHAVLRVWSVTDGTAAGVGVRVHVTATPARG